MESRQRTARHPKLGFFQLDGLNMQIERYGLALAVTLVLAISIGAHWTMVSFGNQTDAYQKSLQAELPNPNTEKHYVSSDRCQSCHPSEHATWHRSFHRTMTQSAMPENVLGRFDGTEIQSNGLRYRVFKEDGRFMAEMPDPDEMMYVFQGNKPTRPEDIPYVTLPVVMTTGSHHYQTYWVGSPKHDRLLQTLPLVYLIKEDKWLPREEAFMRSPDDQGRLITQWNHHCIRCHSTGGSPGLEDESGELRTKVGELGIACESCHGPGEAHVEYYQNPLNRYRAHGQDQQSAFIVNPAKLDHRASSQTCGQCHGVYIMENEYAMTYAREGILYRPGAELDKTRYYIQHPANDSTQQRRQDLEQNPQFFRERWWDDGTILAGGREYTAMTVSDCFTKGEMSCLSCHAMHDSPPADQLMPNMDGPTACIQCHTESRYNSNIEEHTFHPASSAGSNCLNCHMPHTTYALFGAIRTHQIKSPDVTSSAQFGTPNACNLCHLDKSLEWTQKHLIDRYGYPEVKLDREQRTVSATLLWLLKGHAAQRAIAAWHMGWEPATKASGADWQAPFQAQLLTDPYGVVRQVAANRLRNLPGFEQFEYDFLASNTQLQAAKEQAVKLWSKEGLAASPTHESTLQDPDGNIRERLLRRFLSNRDDRPVTIKE